MDIIAMLLLYDIMLIMRFRLQNLVRILTNPLLSLWRAQHSLLRVSLRVSAGRWQTWMNNACRSRGARLELRGARSLPACLPAFPSARIFRLRASSRHRAVAGWRVHGAGSSADDAGLMSESNLILQRGESDMLYYWNQWGDPKKACQ